MLNSSPDSTEQFWIDQEKKLNCKILSFALAQYVTHKYVNTNDKLTLVPPKKNTRSLWGIAFVSEKGFHFYHFPQQNWFSSLVKRDASPSEEYCADLYFAAIDMWKPPHGKTQGKTQSKVSFLQKLLGANDDYLVIVCDAQAHVFNLDLRKKNLIAQLEEKLKHTPIVTL